LKNRKGYQLNHFRFFRFYPWAKKFVAQSLLYFLKIKLDLLVVYVSLKTSVLFAFSIYCLTFYFDLTFYWNKTISKNFLSFNIKKMLLIFKHFICCFHIVYTVFFLRYFNCCFYFNLLTSSCSSKSEQSIKINLIINAIFTFSLR